jgi:hypothetical protein
MISALSVAGAVFLILELDQPNRASSAVCEVCELGCECLL